MLMQKLQEDLTISLKAGQSDRVSTIRFLISAARNAGINKYGAEWEEKLTDADVMDVVKKQVKTHKESIDAFQKAGRAELAAKEQAELAVLQEYAPKELTDKELRALLAPIAKLDEPNFGKRMGHAMAEVKGQADGGRVSAILKELLPK